MAIWLPKTAEKKGYIIYPHQREGVEFFLKSPSPVMYNLDDMGCGKSAQSLLYANASGARQVLVVCPSSLILNWCREINIWYDLSQESYKAYPILGAKSLKPLRIANFLNKTEYPSPVVVSYSMMTKNSHVRDYIESRFWDLIILDEAHYIRNPESIRTALFTKGYGRNTKKIMLLSATPMLQGAHELYIAYKTVLNACKDKAIVEKYSERFSDYATFSMRYAKYFYSKFGPNYYETSRDFDELVGLNEEYPFYILRYKKDVLKDLPDKTYEIQQVSISQKLSDYPQVAEQLDTIIKIKDQIRMTEGEDVDTIDLTGTGVTRKELRAWRKFLGIGKANSKDFHRWMNEVYIEPKVPVIIFCWHRAVVEILQDKFKKYKPAVVIGGMTRNKKDSEVSRFMTGQTDIFLGNITAAGVGLTLTRAYEVVMLEWDWSPFINEQAVDRVYRIGQDNAVRAHYIVSKGCKADMRLAANMCRKLKAMEGKLKSD